MGKSPDNQSRRDVFQLMGAGKRVSLFLMRRVRAAIGNPISKTNCVYFPQILLRRKEDLSTCNISLNCLTQC